MIWALAAALAAMTVFAVMEFVFIRRLLGEEPAVADEEEAGPAPKLTYRERGHAMVDLLCVSIIEKPEQWSFERGILKHGSGTKISLTEDGIGVLIKRGKDTAVINGIDGGRIRDAVLTRNLRASFEDIAKEIV